MNVESILESIRPAVAELVGALDGFEPSDAAELELVALEAIGPFGHPALPHEVVALLPEALLARGDTTAAGVLAAFAELGPSPLRDFAAEARDRLATAGVTSPFAELVGALEVCECRRGRIEASGLEVFAVLLRRPGQRNVQAAALLIEHEPCGGVVVGGLLGSRNLLTLAAEGEATRDEDVVEAVTATLEHMVKHDIELPVDALPALLQLERALSGRAGAWPRPALAGPEVESDEEALADGFASKHGDMAGIADAMCHWKVDYVGDRVDHWTVGDLSEFLLEWYPRKGGAGEPVETVPGGVIAFLRFLDEEGRLAGDDFETLTEAVERLRIRFEREARNRRNWGPAKAMAMQMRAEGVDLMDQEAVAAWVSGFNTRSFDERDRVLGPSLPRPVPQAPKRRKAQRRSTKAARRRNRR